jgi:hypothetical protein
MHLKCTSGSERGHGRPATCKGGKAPVVYSTLEMALCLTLIDCRSYPPFRSLSLRQVGWVAKGLATRTPHLGRCGLALLPPYETLRIQLSIPAAVFS